MKKVPTEGIRQGFDAQPRQQRMGLDITRTRVMPEHCAKTARIVITDADIRCQHNIEVVVFFGWCAGFADA